MGGVGEDEVGGGARDLRKSVGKMARSIESGEKVDEIKWVKGVCGWSWGVGLILKDGEIRFWKILRPKKY